MAPAPAPVQIGTTNAMVQRVDTAYKKAQTTPQLSFGADGMTVQQPVVRALTAYHTHAYVIVYES